MEHFVTNIDILKEKGLLKVEVMYKAILLIYTEGKLYAIEDRCPHLGISLATSKIDNNTIKCKEHGLPISLITGEVMSETQASFLRLDKNSRHIKTYPVFIKDDKVYIKI
ncbi:Rieske (2Fe-2S) protein [Liberiplasma polymorphum]|jgi:nitrite reductase/ring-hydroxylating ferredoxin subunit|uniref:Rieske (2Fe-2S) protein n=1 Tax=Liberiplasma polymorphum TaxID=3374570 RepID=UPI0037715DA2